MQIRLKTLIGVLVFACAHAFLSIGATPSVIAQQFPQTDLEDLKAADLVELYKLQKELGSPEGLDVWEPMFDERQRYLPIQDAATNTYLDTYRHKSPCND